MDLVLIGAAYRSSIPILSFCERLSPGAFTIKPLDILSGTLLALQPDHPEMGMVTQYTTQI
jgi:hypothetical protein